MYLFLTNECSYSKEKIQIFYHAKKTHGLDEDIFKEIKKSDVDFMIIPDAGSNDIEQIKDLLKLGKRVLILDHHQINDEEQNTKFVDQEGNVIGVIVNNQLDEYSTNLSGVGVVWKLLSYLTEDELEHYLDLVAIGNIADSMYLNDFELRYIVNKGLKNINNELIKEFIINAKLEDDSLTPTDISFNIANYINATIRFGSLQEKEDLFKALIGEEEEIEYTPRKSKSNPNPQTEIQTLQKAMVRISKSIKTKQDNAKKKSVEKCKQFIMENNLNENKAIILIDENNELIDRKITGLIAMNLVSIYKKSVVLLGKTKKGYTGSIRGFGVNSFKEILESTEIIKITGHDNSAGIFVETKDIPRLIKRINRAMEDIEVIPPCTLVDCKIDLNNIREKEMQEVLNLKPLWHQHCTEPLFLIEDLIIDSKKIRNPYATLITFNVNGIEIKKEYCSGVWKKEFLKEDVVKFGKPTLKCNLIVKVDYDNYRNKPCLSIVEAKSEVINNTKKDNIPF